MSDAEDLEDELLMAAGRRGGHDDDSSLDEREEQNDKKRKRTPARRKGSDADSSDGSDDLYEDEADRKKLEAMNELEREMILAERAQERDKKRQRKQLLKGKAQARSKEDKSGTLSGGEVRASSRRAREVTDKDRAMDRLFAARERATEARGARKAKGGSDDGEDSSADEDRGGSDADDESREDEDGDDAGDDVGDKRDDQQPESDDGYDEDDDEVSTLEELHQIQVRRTLLEKWFTQPFFEECMPGVLVRCACGERKDPHTLKQVANYVLFEVEEVVTDRDGKPLMAYKFGPNQVRTNKWLHVRDGRDEQYMQMMMVSNQALTQEEVDTWISNVKRSKRPLLQRSEFQKTKENIDKAEKYKYTSQDVQKILKEKREKGIAPANFVHEKMRLTQQRDNAALAGDDSEVARLDKLLQEIDAKFTSDKHQRMRAQGMSSVNRRNKDYNNAIALKQTAAAAAAAKGASGGKAAVDVFSRRATRPPIYWRTSTKDEAGNGQEAAANAAGDNAEALSMSQQKMDPVELLKELNLDIDVSIVRDLQQLQHPLPRKLLGSKWQESLSSFAHMDLSNKTLLSVADWRERADALQP